MQNPFKEIESRLVKLEELLQVYVQQQKALHGQHQKDQWLSLDELIDYLPGKQSKSTVYNKVYRKEIPHRKFGKHLVFLKSEIDQLIQSDYQKTNDEIDQEANNYLNDGK